MHGHHKMGIAPASDARASPLPKHRCRFWGFFIYLFFTFFFTDLRLLVFDSRWFLPNQVDLAKIKLYRPNRIVSTGGQNWPKWPKLTEMGLESCRNSRNCLWMRPKHLKFCHSSILFWIFVASFVFSFWFCVSFLLLSLFFERRTYNVFFKNILIIKIFVIIF